MVRSELIAILCRENPDLPKAEMERIVDIFFDEISKCLIDGGRVELRGFGVFDTRFREGRKGRNPKTGATVDVAPTRIPFFTVSKNLVKWLTRSADLPTK